jgi:hypothetical protein
MSNYPIVLGHTEAHERLTARVYYDPDGSGYLSLGNIVEYRYTPTRNTIERKISEKGWVRVEDELVVDVKEAWECVLDEEDADTARFLRLATPAATVTQSAASAGIGLVSNVKQGRYYDIGLRRLSNVTVKVGASTKTEGTDYILDRDAGILYIVPGGSIADNSTVEVTSDVPEVKHQVWTGLRQVRFGGPVMIHEFNQHDPAPLREIRFTGVIIATAFPEHTGEIGRWTVRITARTVPTIRKRFSRTPV